MSEILVGPDGPPHANIYFVGEAPGQIEVQQGKPFVGRAGGLLWQICLKQGLHRSEARVNNILHFKLPANNWKQATRPQLTEGLEALKQDVRKCKPNLVVLLGANVLEEVTGKTGISNWRGSLLWSEELQVKLLPTYHPAGVLRNWDDFSPLFFIDLKKAVREAKTPVYKPPTYHFTLNPSFDDVFGCLSILHTDHCPVAFDIESFVSEETGLATMRCIAFAWSEEKAICIPTTRGYWGEGLDEIMKMLKGFLEGSSPKTAQNGQFDIAVLRVAHNIEVKNLVFDTMCAQHVAYPEFPKSLACQASLYTNQPFYKFLGRSEDSTEFYRYNALDAAVTYKAAEALEANLKERGLLVFYQRVVHPLIPLMLELQHLGVRMDWKEMVRQEVSCEMDFVEALSKLKEVCGKEVNPLSPKQLKILLYEQLGFSPVIKGGKPTTDEEALRKLEKKHKHPVFDLVLKARKAVKLASTYLDVPKLLRRSPEGEWRMHTSYNIGGRLTEGTTGRVVSAPETGRLSSSRSIVFQSGTNLQNIPRGSFRKIFLPEKGHLVLEADLSQAEARVVAYEANVPRLIQLFESGGDIHKQNASWIFQKPLADITKQERTFAKTHVHAFNYGEGPRTFAARSGLSVSEGQKRRDLYFLNAPEILAWHQTIQNRLKTTRELSNLLGRKRHFFGRLNDNTFRAAFAYIPQSTVGDLLNVEFVETWTRVRELGLEQKAKPMLQVHDAQVWSVAEEWLETLISIIQKASDIQLEATGGTFNIPAEFKVGPNWGELEDWKGV